MADTDMPKFIQISTAENGEDGSCLYALDSSGDVWQFTQAEARATQPGKWKRLPSNRK
jgi:hypothetical protein